MKFWRRYWYLIGGILFYLIVGQARILKKDYKLFLLIFIL